MRILFVADGRSPTAISWIEYFVNNGDEVHLASTFDCDPAIQLASYHFLPVAYSGAIPKEGNRSGMRRYFPTSFRTQLRNWLGPLTLSTASRHLHAVIDAVKPGLIHAMRIPFEGMLAATAQTSVPLVISVWGNDFTLHARSNPFMGAATQRTMRRAAALHSDTQRDLRLAESYGFNTEKPSLLVPGNGGVRSEIFYPSRNVEKPGSNFKVINPRGIRSYVRNDIFFQAIPLVLAKLPEARFGCPGMEGELEAQRWVERLRINEHVSLMPKLSAPALAEAYRAAEVMVSPSIHDGTPNSLLEAMACGVFPICGDLESIREWITDGENGLLVDPTDPKLLADAIMRTLKNSAMRKRAAKMNIEIVAKRADYSRNMEKVGEFYDRVLTQTSFE